MWKPHSALRIKCFQFECIEGLHGVTDMPILPAGEESDMLEMSV